MNCELLKNAMADLDEDAVIEVMNGVSDARAASEALDSCKEGMDIVGQRFEEGEYFVGDLIYAGELMTEAVAIIKPLLAAENSQSVAKVLLCTVKDDLHDIGKNIVKAIMEAAGFEILDLGIDVAPATIVETAKKENIKIIALSGVLTLALDSMKATVEAFQEAGMREDVKIIIGGNPVSEKACETIGADAWAHSPQKTVDVCKGWV